MKQIIQRDNHIVPEKPFNTIKPLQPNYKFGHQNTHSNTQKNTPSLVPNNNNIKQDDDSKSEDKLNFFSSSEADLCLKIIKAIQKECQTLLVSLPPYAQDKLLAQRIANYVSLPNTKSVVINAEGLSAKQIISEFIQQLSLKSDDNIYHEFARLMTDYFHHGFVLHSIIYNTQSLTKQDFDYLYELASLIYEKFPKQRHKPLIRFIFIGDKSVIPILRKKTNHKFQQFTVNKLTVTECINALYLYTDCKLRNELFYQTVGNYASGLRIASAGYPALLRLLLPLPQPPSLADKKMPENYLSAIINRKIDVKYHREIQNKRLLIKKSHHFLRPRTYIRLSLGIFSVILVLLGYYFYNNPL